MTKLQAEDLKSQLSQLSDVAMNLGRHSSRLDATVHALEFYTKLLQGSEGPEEIRVTPTDVLERAVEMGDYGFTLEELISVVGPDVVYYPRRYKNELSRVLRGAGFTRKQVRRDGQRPLVWFAPGQDKTLT